MLFGDYSEVKNAHDVKLCEIAEQKYPDEWGEIDESQAVTKEGKDALHRIKMFLYHREEYGCGCGC